MPVADPLATLVLAELEHVYDPEVDEPVTQMGFIREVEIAGTEGAENVIVHMQLPQYFCAPNFTYLMVDDVRRAAEKVVGEGNVHVSLVGHFEADKINGAMTEGSSFTDVFADAIEDLDTLRDRFARKTFLIRQERVCKVLDKSGIDSEKILDLDLADVAGFEYEGELLDKYLSTRTELGIDTSSEAPFLVAADGRPVEPDKLRLHRRSASVMAVSFEGNGMMCKTLIHERYPDSTVHPTAEITRGEVA
ncbi:MAG: iron-sulfur cluster assembly protein [Vicinamibacterales bacterium]